MVVVGKASEVFSIEAALAGAVVPSASAPAVIGRKDSYAKHFHIASSLWADGHAGICRFYGGSHAARLAERSTAVQLPVELALARASRPIAATCSTSRTCRRICW